MTKATTILIKNPRITEKASMVSEKNIYTFDVVGNANKTELKKAVFALYKVKPVKVNVVTIKEKQVRSRKGIKGTKSGGKKAIVYLEKGDKIEIV